MKKYFLIILIIVALGLVASVSSAATMPTKMIGYAWAPNFGWLNFGSDGAQSSPQVSIDTAGNFSGYAWSPNLGWFVISPNLRGPNGRETGVKATASASDPNTFTISGWFRSCAVYTNGCPNLPYDIGRNNIKDTSGTDLGSWDGWVKMNNVTYNSDTKRYSGFAWGALVAGWINFSATSGNNGNPPNTPCNPAVEVCGDNGGGGPTISCSANNGATSVGLREPVTWSASVNNGSGVYNYSWKSLLGEAWGPYATQTYIHQGYPTPGQKSAQVTVTQGATSIGTCTASINVSGCSLTVEYGGNNGNVVVKDKTLGTVYPNNTAVNVSCNSAHTLNTYPTTNIDWKEGSCSTGTFAEADKNKSEFGVSISGGSKTVCANFGGGGDITVNFPNGNMMTIPDNFKTSNQISIQVFKDGLPVSGLSSGSFTITNPGGLGQYNPVLTYDSLNGKIYITLNTDNRDRLGNQAYTLSATVNVDGETSDPFDFIVRDNQTISR